MVRIGLSRNKERKKHNSETGKVEREREMGGGREEEEQNQREIGWVSCG